MNRRGWSYVERGLLLTGIACLGTFAHVTLDAERFRAAQARQLAAVPAPADVDAPAAMTHGAPLGMLEIPRLRLSSPVVEGDDEGTLRRAIGHLPDTPLPWQTGNAAIAGHRDGLFRPLRRITVGDDLFLHTPRGPLRYRVVGTRIVEPTDLSVLAPRSRDTLTLITCYPFSYIGPAPKRFVVHAERESPATGGT